MFLAAAAFEALGWFAVHANYAVERINSQAVEVPDGWMNFSLSNRMITFTEGTTSRWGFQFR